MVEYSLTHETSPIVLFDGVCNLCSGLVQFITRRDRHAPFRFAALQSDAGQVLLDTHSLPKDSLDTFYVIDGERAYDRSGAALFVVGRLRWPWPLLGILRIVPLRIRAWLYSLVARHRYAIFGSARACMLPSREILGRFVR